MSDFLTIKESKQKFLDGISKSASFIAVVISEGELKGGTSSSGEDWTRKEFTIQDASETIKIQAWNEEIKTLKVGYKYEFNSPYWKDYKGNPQLSMGQYCQVKCIGSDGAQQKMPTEDIPPAPKGVGSVNGEKLPEINTNFKEFVIEENIILAQIEQVVIEEMKRYQPTMQEINGQKVGLRVKEIYRQSKLSKFEKGNHV